MRFTTYVRLSNLCKGAPHVSPGTPRHNKGEIHVRTPARPLIGTTLKGAVAAGAALLVSLGLAVPAAAATSDPRVDTIYDSEPADPAVSYPSLGYAATQTLEFGDRVALAGEARVVQEITVGMNSWACEDGSWNLGDCVTTPGSSYEHDLTVHVYAVGAAGAVGAELASVTQTFAIPYRPSADGANCAPANVGDPDQQWYSAEKDSCQNGYSFPATFDLSALDLELPGDVIVTVTFATGGDANSLNVEAIPSAPSVGTNPDADLMYIDYGNDALPLATEAGWATDYDALRMTITAIPAADAVEVAPIVIGFEDETSSDLGIATRVDNGLMAASGCWYAEAPVTNYGTVGTEGYAFTRYSGYATVFPTGGYTASADFYLDTTEGAGQFSWSHAVNGTDGNHTRDFIFHADSDGAGTWTVGVNNNASTSAPDYHSTYSVTPAVITESGWYTFQHAFYEDGGVLWADLAVLDDDGAEVASWTLGGNAADEIPTIVGGNRYGWLVKNDFAGLAIDNVLLDSERPEVGCADTAALAALIEKAQGIDKDAFTPETLETLSRVLSNALEVLGTTRTTQAAVDTAAAELSDAIDGLEPVEELAATGADVTAVTAAAIALAAAGALLVARRRRV